MTLPLSRWVLCTAGFLWSLTGYTQEPKPHAADHPLTLAETFSNVSAQHPWLEGYRLKAKAFAADRQTSKLKPPLEFSADADEFAGTNEASGLEGVELTLALSSVIELGDRPGARIGLIDAQQDLLSAQRRTVLLDALANAAKLFVDIAALQQELLVAQKALALSQESEQAVRRRVQRGRATKGELQRAEAATAKAALEVGHIEHQIPSARVQLAALWGDTQPSFSRVDDDALFHPGRSGRFDTIVADLERNPDLMQLASESRIAAANLRLAHSNTRGSVRWRAGVRRQESSNSTGLVAGFSMPLFSNQRGSAAVDAAQSREEAAMANRDAALISMRATLFEAWQHREHAIEAFSLLRDSIIPLLESALAETQKAYQAGRYSYLELISARKELIEARLALVDAARRAHLNRIELERMAGAPLRDTLTAPSSPKETNHDH